MNNFPENSVDLAIFTPTIEGGVGRIIDRLAVALARKGYTIDIVTTHVREDSMISPEVNIVNLDVSRTISALPKLIKYLRERKPKALMSVIYHANIIAWLAKKISGSLARMIMCEQVALVPALTRENFFIRAVLKLLVRLLYRLADKVITVSQNAASDLRSLGVPSGNIEVIYNFVDLPDALRLADENVSHEWFSNKTMPVVLGVGRLEWQKDFRTLIQAFAIARKKHPARLVIIGDGPEKKELNDLINQLNLSEHIQLFGFTKNPFPYFKLSDVFVLSSRYEGMPLVLAEALALGLAVVSTDCPSGPREILKGGQLGKLVPVGDEKRLSEAIVQLLESPHQRVSTIDIKEYTLDFAVTKYEQIIFST